LQIFGDFFSNDLFQASGAAAVLAIVKRQDWRIVTTPTCFTPGRRPAVKL
jgi:hypothetical protein